VGGGLREAVFLRQPLPVWKELRGTDETRVSNGRLEDLPAAWQDIARVMAREPFARHWAAWLERGSPR
jgi:hypothetical protein